MPKLDGRHYIENRGCSGPGRADILPARDGHRRPPTVEAQPRGFEGLTADGREVGGLVGWGRPLKRSPPSAVHDLVERASVQPLDDGQRLSAG